MQITFRPDGTAEHVGDSDLLAGSVQSATKRRASNVEPHWWLLRLAFHLLRGLEWLVNKIEGHADETVTEWTREWPCLWRVRVVGGPTWGQYRSRAAAIRDEIEWLEANRL